MRGDFNRGRGFAIFAILVVAWVVIDRIAKSALDSNSVGETIAIPLPGILDITLVHNTGAAWGILNGNACILGIFSVIVCILAIVYLALCRPPATIATVIGLSLIVAGGMGNAFDRFSLGYVVDFIRPVFIDFPVFNIADIGVCVGVAIFVVSLLLEALKRPNDEKATEA